MIRHKKTEDLLLSITKNCQTLNDQTQTKPEEALKIKFTKSRETCRFNPPIPIERSWIIGLTSLEINKSIFITNKFELFTDTFDEFGFIEFKDVLQEIPNIPDITTEDLQDDRLGSLIIEAYRKIYSEKSNTDGYFILSMYHARSPFRDFESFLRLTGDLNDDDIQLILKTLNFTFRLL